MYRNGHQRRISLSVLLRRHSRTRAGVTTITHRRRRQTIDHFGRRGELVSASGILRRLCENVFGWPALLKIGAVIMGGCCSGADKR